MPRNPAVVLTYADRLAERNTAEAGRRAQAILRRSGVEGAGGPVSFGDGRLTIDEARHEVTVDAAIDTILSKVEPLPARPCLLSESLGLVLAQDLIAREEHPPFDNSAMDGYAVQAADLPGRLRVVEEIAAGAWPTCTLQSGQAARIMTGAPMPDGSDAVVMVEHTRRVEPDQMESDSPLKVGENVRRRGEHLQIGQVAFEQGQAITPAALAMAAYLGYPRPLCHPRLRVAVVSTGDELVEPHGEDWSLAAGQIRNSNAFGLEAKLRCLGCDVTRTPAVPDDPVALRQVLAHQLECQDALITSAGVSMGEKDYVLRVLAELGAELVFWKVAMRPGRPLGFGTWKGKPIFALPGNPVSSMVTFDIFCRPALLKMMGHRSCRPQLESARCAVELTKKAGLRLYYRCRVERRQGELWAAPTGRQDSHLLVSLVQADALMILPEASETIAVGETIQLLWPDGTAARNHNR